jgi:hypothetical protein
MKIKLIFISSIFIFFLYQGTAVAATGDVIDNFSFFSSAVCAGVASAVQIDVDGIYNGDPYGDNETMVVFWTITGVASPVNEDPPPGKWYFFSPDDTDCGGEAPWERARVLIRFVDMLDPDFVPANSDTWVWKGIETVSIRTLHDLCVAPDIPAESASISVQAYGNINQSEMITGTNTNEGEWERHDFSDQGGIMELDVSSDFCNNLLDDLILDDAPISYPPHSCDTADYWVVGDFELIDAIDKWVAGGNCGDLPVGDFVLIDLIDFWVFGSYCWDTTSEVYRTGSPGESGECL